MHYYVLIQNGYLVSLGTSNMQSENAGSVEVTEVEYNEWLSLINNKPTAPNGYEYWITENGEYELHETEPMPEPDGELTIDEWAKIGQTIMGEVPMED